MFRTEAVRRTGRNKLRTYSQFKTSITSKSYIKVILAKEHWSALKTFRCGVAPIRIETGWYENVYEDNKLCLLCNDNAIENEEH